ncbi:MAG: metalloregulator ArsR/SmtB family transcription factor [Candidatus Anammoximicrobium sp.]|nr:metalloregulator ArsR/SmtB family transcription factor [Candidatus Anammoximicrobium sp.]
MISRVSSVLKSEASDEDLALGSGTAIRDLAQLFKLLADETRLRILEMLGRREELCVRDLWERLGQSQPAVSHHLGLLRMAGLVGTRQEGKHIYYRIDQHRLDELMTVLQSTGVGTQMLAHVSPTNPKSC